MESLGKSQGKKNLRAAGDKVFDRGTSQGTPFNMIPLRLFHTKSFFCCPQLVLVPKKYHTKYTPLAFANIDSVKSNIRARDLEGIYIGL